MTKDEMQEYLATLSDGELKVALTEAHDDLMKAADEQPNSEWHGTCFAATLVYSQEMNRRGLKLATTH